MTRGCLVYTHPAAFGRRGHPVSLITTCPVTVGMSDAFAHDCHCPLSRLPARRHQPHRARPRRIGPPGSTKQRETETGRHPRKHDDRDDPAQHLVRIYHTTNSGLGLFENPTPVEPSPDRTSMATPMGG